MLATQDLIYQCKKLIETSQIDRFQEFVRGMLDYRGVLNLRTPKGVT